MMTGSSSSVHVRNVKSVNKSAEFAHPVHFVEETSLSPFDVDRGTLLEV